MSSRQFWAIAVGDLDALSGWYVRAFALVASETLYPEDGSRAVALHGPDLLVELKQRAEPVARLDAADGYFKVGLFVADVGAEHERMVAAGAQPIVGVTDQPELGLRFSIVADPEGNLIQLFEEL